MIRVWKLALHCTSKYFLLFVFKTDYAMILHVTICSNYPFILLSNTEGCVVLYGFVMVVGVLTVGFRTECMAIHFSRIAWDTDGVVGTV